MGPPVEGDEDATSHAEHPRPAVQAAHPEPWPDVRGEGPLRDPRRGAQGLDFETHVFELFEPVAAPDASGEEGIGRRPGLLARCSREAQRCAGGCRFEVDPEDEDRQRSYEGGWGGRWACDGKFE